MPTFRKYLPRHMRKIWSAMEERHRDINHNKSRGQHPLPASMRSYTSEENLLKRLTRAKGTMEK